MSARVKDLLPLVTTLSRMKPRQQKTLLGMCSGEQVHAMEELALNIVKNTTPLNRNHVAVSRDGKGH